MDQEFISWAKSYGLLFAFCKCCTHNESIIFPRFRYQFGPRLKTGNRNNNKINKQVLNYVEVLIKLSRSLYIKDGAS